MDNLFTGSLMSLMFLIFMIVLRKKYNISIKLMVVLHIVFTITGAFGASLGSVLSGMTWAGKRLHLLMVVDTLTLLGFCKIGKIDDKQIGDYLAIPIIAVCAASKIGCVIFGCCYGFEMFTNQLGEPVRFPSQAFELSLWIGLMIFLFFIKSKGNSKGVLWPIALIWFGIIRYAVDFLRGSALSKIIILFNMPGGQLYSLLALIIGIVYLWVSLKKIKGEKPTLKEMVYISIGKEIDAR